MVTKITEGVKISVETFYQDEYSQPFSNEYMFAYRITIENQSDHAIQLLRRHWYVFDSCGVTREVEGEGVVGLQPVIEPGKSHQYVSGSHLKTEIGKMYGTYLIERVEDGKRFKVNIPEFQLVAPFKMN